MAEPKLNEVRNQIMTLITFWGLAILAYTLLQSSLIRRDVGDTKSIVQQIQVDRRFKQLTKDQQNRVIFFIEKAQKIKVDLGKVQKQVQEYEKIALSVEDNLEGAEKSMRAGNTGKALDYIINAKEGIAILSRTGIIDPNEYRTRLDIIRKKLYQLKR